MLEALEPRYSHHCYVRADDRHASAIGPIRLWIPVFLLGLFTSGIQALVFATLAAA